MFWTYVCYGGVMAASLFTLGMCLMISAKDDE